MIWRQWVAVIRSLGLEAGQRSDLRIIELPVVDFELTDAAVEVIPGHLGIVFAAGPDVGSDDQVLGVLLESLGEVGATGGQLAVEIELGALVAEGQRHVLLLADADGVLGRHQPDRALAVLESDLEASVFDHGGHVAGLLAGEVLAEQRVAGDAAVVIGGEGQGNGCLLQLEGRRMGGFQEVVVPAVEVDFLDDARS